MFRNKRQKSMTEPMVVVDHSKQESIRNSLTKELETVIKAAISSPHSSTENIPSEITQNLCNSIEAIFIHGLKDPFFLKGTRYAKYPEPNFWPFVSKYSHKNVTNQIGSLKQIKTEIGKSRAWIRLVLNENSLGYYLDLLAAEKGSIQQFYGEEAFLRYLGDNEYSEQIRGILKPLGKLPIYAATNSSFLNTWTPTPLILAGLMTGKPLKVGVLTARRNPKSGSDREEVAVSALEMLVPEEDHDIGSPNRLNKRNRLYSRPKQKNSDEDDNSSVYSHPSMLDAGEMTYQHAVTSNRRIGQSTSNKKSSSSNHRLQLPQSPLFASTPIENTILDNVVKEQPVKGPITVVPRNEIISDVQNFAPLIVSRRTKRPSKHSSRSSSGSVSADGKFKTEQTLSVRESRANSDLPSTIFGTVPNDVCFSMDDNKMEEKQNMGKEVDNISAQQSESVSFLDAMNQLAISESLANSENSVDFCNGCEMKKEFEKTENQNIMNEEDVFNVEIEAAENPKQIQEEVKKEEGNADAVQPAENQLAVESDSILGTSLRDELLEALPQSIEDNETFEQGVPIFVQSPNIMGNSLAAIGARNHMNWESMSERSRLSSSSESYGPAVSFGQALRSAMENGENDEFDDSLCTSTGNNMDADDSVIESSGESRKSSKSSTFMADLIDKLCTIPREKGLDSQDFRCAMCRKSIGGSTFAKFETCGIDGKYYCTDCMQNGGKSAIPARVLMDWDWRERLISDRGRSWIEANQEKPLINIMDKNEKLYSHVAALRETKNIREKLQLVSMYLFNCRESVAEDFRRRVWPKEYLHAEIHKYSFSDLIEVKSGTLQKKLLQLFKHAISHIIGCTLCRQKGFICELCSINEVIYPFQTEDTHRCQVCFSVFHKKCWETADECPKCVRRQQFEARRAQIDDPHSVLILQP